jgi:Zn-dependent peptidase ImmA (M78 family)/transcriptional regulator with XRE-family HTH domain
MKEVEFVNKNNLRIARENMGLTTLSASKKVTSSKQDIVAQWENGESLPTWPQITKLANAYSISELLLLSKQAIQQNKIIPDYRVGIKNEGDEKVKKLINLVISRQKWLEKKLQESGQAKNKLQGSGKNIQNHKEMAGFIANQLQIDTGQIKNFRGAGGRKKALGYLIERTESHNIFVGKTISYHKLKVDDMRGLFISNDYCPFIILNRSDALSAQIFSFVHELTHLFRKSDSISNSLEFRTTRNGANSEEVFCNKVAVEFLLPEQDFTNVAYDKTDIANISEIYKVSEICILYRLVELGKVRKSNQYGLEKEILAEMAENLKRKKEAQKDNDGGNFYNLMKDSNGDLFNRVVADSYFSNNIDYVEASNLLRFSAEMV